LIRDSSLTVGVVGVGTSRSVLFSESPWRLRVAYHRILQYFSEWFNLIVVAQILGVLPKCGHLLCTFVDWLLEWLGGHIGDPVSSRSASSCRVTETLKCWCPLMRSRICWKAWACCSFTSSPEHSSW